MIQEITKQLAESKMPLFWQQFGLIHALIVIITAFIPNPDIRFTLYPIIGVMILIGLGASIKQQIIMRKNWYLMMVATIFFEISVILSSLSHFGIIISGDMIFYTKQMGIIILAIFGIYTMIFIEKKFNLEGVIIDFILVLLSFVSAIFIIYPKVLQTLLTNYTYVQQFALANIILGTLIVMIGIVHQIFTKHFKLKVFLLLLSLTFFVLHFNIEFLISSNESQSIEQLSWFLFQIIGTFNIFYSFLERFELKYAYKANRRVSFILTWGASILAIVIVPIALAINLLANAENRTLLTASVAGLLLSSFVVWRFFILVKTFNDQKEKLKNVAYTDKLTGVLSYFGFCEEFLEADNTNNLLVSVNIDDFKSINDLYGRGFGDEIIINLSKRLLALSNVKLVSRIAADHFIVLLSTPMHKANEDLISIQTQLGIWDSIDGKRIAVPLTLGATHSNTSIDVEILSRQAEKAQKFARTKHLSTYLYSEKEGEQLSLPRHDLREILQKAIDENYLPVHFQPIYNIEDGSLKALELLIRVNSSTHGILQPGQFLDQARIYGLLADLTKVCVHMIAVNYKNLPDVVININLAPHILENKEIINDFISFFKSEQLPLNRFCIEITEDEDVPVETLVHAINIFKEKGFSIAMDDFGTGYSSLSRLSLLSFDTVKIDRSLLLAAANGNSAILESSIQLIKRLGLLVVVEGVETLEQLRLIQKLGADSVQGYLLSRPVDTQTAFSLPLNATSIINNFKQA